MVNNRVRRLIMESVPNEAGKRTTYNALFFNVASYCNELGFDLASDAFLTALKGLQKDQCLVYFNENNIKPTQYGLNKYNQ